MGISRDSRHKRRATGGKRAIHQKKKKYELGRPAALTKLGNERVHVVRTRGGNHKYRALRLDSGSFSWGSQQISFKTKINNVVYNPTSNELVRTNTITKSSIVAIDANPFITWYYTRYGVNLGKNEIPDEESKSRSVQAKHAKRLENENVCPSLLEQFKSGRLFAIITTRPGQSGVCNGYILEGEELEFYKKKLDKKRRR
ncbi:small ribosomal subunit protein eS8-like [Dermatophagoides farinae]|uniref:small ribosomal subunit protein eS8-like n=1 Tax=Dermatophagoides farinae TaxID=6954 RepID=UPI003F6215E9